MNSEEKNNGMSQYKNTCGTRLFILVSCYAVGRSIVHVHGGMAQPRTVSLVFRYCHGQTLLMKVDKIHSNKHCWKTYFVVKINSMNNEKLLDE